MLLKKEVMFVNKLSVKTSELFTCNIPFLKKYFDESTYPWEILPKIKDIVKELINNGIEGYTLIKEGVLVGKNVRIAETATIIPPTIIGNDTEIRPGAYLRGNIIIGDKCVIGNSSELKNAILLTHVQVPHYNYVGDSILGNDSHMGAGSICSNLRNDGKNIIIHADKDYETGLRKIGALLGDGVQIGCGSVLNPGTIIGKHSLVYPLTMTRGVYPADSMIKSTKEIDDLK